MKIKICIPTYNNIDGARSGLSELKKVCRRVAGDTHQYKDCYFTVCFAKGTYPKGQLKNRLLSDNIAQVRNDVVDLSYDKTFFIDSDIVFRFSDLLTVLEMPYKVSAAPYIGHAEKHLHQCGKWLQPGESKERYSTNCSGVFPVDWMGMGFACIDNSVFKTMEYPWFRHQMVQFSDGMQDEVQEDYGFCMMLTALGIPIMMNFDVKLKHLPPEKSNFNY